MPDFSSAMGSGGSGWSNFGQALGQAMSGGGSQKVYDETMLRGHRTQKALADAQKATLEYNSMTSMQEALEDMGLDTRTAAGAATLINGGGANFDQAMSGRMKMTQGDALAGALEQVTNGGGMAAANPYLGVAEGKPVQLTKVEGNTIISPYEAMSAQTPQVSPYGQGYLQNQAIRVAGQNAAGMASATRPRASKLKADDPEKIRKDDIKATARDAFFQLREAARTDDTIDPMGITQADIEYAIERDGGWTSPTGMEYRVVTQRPGVPMDSDLAGAIEAGVITPPPAPAPGLPAAKARGTASPAAAMSGAPVTEPKGTPRAAAGEDLSFIPRMDFATGEIAGTGASLPEAARRQLKEGQVTTFGNGQKWTLENGSPKRVN